jgi:DNA topoisomerase-1
MDEGLVDAYQTRRVLDRLYGYEVSPVLWKKVMPKLSAGRVQSVAIRLVVDRERERIAFTGASYWDLEAEFAPQAQAKAAEVASFGATLVSVDGKRVAQGRDFGSNGQLKTADLLHLDGAAAGALAARLDGAAFTVGSVERKPYRRSPYAPFRTTTLQQEASRKLGFSAKYAMQIAQRLYENGHITYADRLGHAVPDRDHGGPRQARELYGAGHADAPRTYTSKVKSAQEAHEAIRRRGPVPHARPGESVRRRAAPLRPDLEAHGGLPDEGRDRRVGPGPRPGAAAAAAAPRGAEFAAPARSSFYGFLKAYVEAPTTRTPSWTTTSAACRRWPSATR